MAVVVVPLKFRDADALPGLVFPTTTVQYSLGNGTAGSQVPQQYGIFPDGVLSGCGWAVTPAAVGAAPTLIVTIDWIFPSSNAVGNVKWGAAVASPGATQSLLAKSFATAVTAAGAVNTTGFPNPIGGLPATVGGAKQRTTIALAAQLDSFSSTQQQLFVKVFRDGLDSATDTASGDAWVFGINVNFLDT